MVDPQNVWFTIENPMKLDDFGLRLVGPSSHYGFQYSTPDVAGVAPDYREPVSSHRGAVHEHLKQAVHLGHMVIE